MCVAVHVLCDIVVAGYVMCVWQFMSFLMSLVLQFMSCLMSLMLQVKSYVAGFVMCVLQFMSCVTSLLQDVSCVCCSPCHV